ncbi:carbon catabolite repressor 4 like protein [Babesia gibsoni]|uniref:Carbon catabolite repressor 4 like protein n=1 Tax=Babesia gibsoni TaxID=33632 RepID=A0AAD8LR44_BABGI|nr:carbon catabolite repressor 4 like protein [Babesia gibsoni]
MTNLGDSYALIKAPDGTDKINITVHWSGRVVNLDRQKNETLKTVITRLKRSLQKHKPTPHVNVQDIRDPYMLAFSNYVCWKKPADCKAPECQKQNPSEDVDSTQGHDGSNKKGCDVDNEYSIQFMKKMFEPYDETETLEEVAKNASFMSINGTILQLHKNAFRLLEVSIGSNAMIGCPVSIHIRSDGPWSHEDIYFHWVNDEGETLCKRAVFVPDDDMEGMNVKLRLYHKQLKWNRIESDFCEVIDVPRNTWQEDRIIKFNDDIDNCVVSPLQSNFRDLRVMSFNILSPTYVATEEAIERFFPYCNPEWLESSYRNPLILREIMMIKPQVLCLQECSTGAYRDYLEPVLGQDYHSWLTIKSVASDEGCCMLVQKCVLDVKDVKSVTFKDEIVKPYYSEILNRIGAPNWINFDIETYFSRYHTIFQLGCFKNMLDFNANYLFVANTHLYFHPHGRHVRILQTFVMLTELEKFKRECAKKYGFNLETQSSTVICGDFNSFPSEGVFQLMNYGWIPSNHPDFEYGMKHTHEKFKPNEHLRSPDSKPEVMYYPLDPKDRVEVENCEGYQDVYKDTKLPFTNFVKTFHGTLDYIYHSRNIRAKRCMPGIKKEDAEEYEGLPSKIYPSDHISIAADF